MFQNELMKIETTIFAELTSSRRSYLCDSTSSDHPTEEKQ
ncbi:hypothetical protein CNE_BB1p03110 (plasmid) [Cupriavidus necator N-1]|uniref:Uncharacterized protein n=1 Tax=Cupriavidus necator (strain ATCC 43291 / DSM 13513 / CCUG 52238 / LMG 8453 / N-1) TaxID=1042878 RepID=F8GWL5_CUPNN|nr:hypothetical protein CNE_BB1p03110 [Cupriavidus necator N-1]